MTTIIEGVILAYSKLFKNPIVTALYLICFIQLIDMTKGLSPTLFDQLISILEQATTKPVIPLAKALASAILWLFKIVNNYRNILVPQTFVWIPYLLTDTSSELMFSLVLSSLTLILTSWSMIQSFVYTQLWYLYSELDNVWYKIVIVILALVTFMYEPFNLEEGSSAHEAVKSIIVSFPNINYTS